VTDPFLPLTDLSALEAALARSQVEPILIFKHSATCGISAQAHYELAEWRARHGSRAMMYKIDVRSHRDVSNAVADRFRIRHESPQIVLVEDGAVRWHRSHWHVNGREVQQALDSLTAASG
jgi:bacillithiol system protein YtxJ